MGVFERLFVGGRPVLTTDHKTDELAHPFLLNPKGYKTKETQSGQSGYWAKIGTVTMQAEDKDFSAEIHFMSGIGTSNTQRGEWYVKIMQTGALGTAPVIKSRLKKYSYISVDQVKVVVVQNDSVQTKCELYIKIGTEFNTINFLPYHQYYHERSMFVRWWKDDDTDAPGLYQTLPTGTAYDAVEDITFCKATSDLLQTTTAATWTKVLYKVEANDYKSEYDAPNSRFIPNQNGVYTVNASIRMTSPSSANFRSLGIYVNGVLSARIANGNGPFLMGSASIKVNAFDIVEVYTYSPDVVSIEAWPSDTYFTIKN